MIFVPDIAKGVRGSQRCLTTLMGSQHPQECHLPCFNMTCGNTVMTCMVGVCHTRWFKIITAPPHLIVNNKGSLVIPVSRKRAGSVIGAEYVE